MGNKNPDSILEIVEKKNYSISDEEKREYLKLKGRAFEFENQLNCGWFKIFYSTYKNSYDIYKWEELNDKLTALEDIDRALYAIVKDECTNDTMSAIEKNQRTVFHRTAKSAIKNAIISGFPFELNPVDSVTKNLLVSYKPGEPQPNFLSNKIDSLFNKLRDILIKNNLNDSICTQFKNRIYELDNILDHVENQVRTED